MRLVGTLNSRNTVTVDRIRKNIMQLAYRSTRRYEPNKRDTLVSSRPQAFALIADLDQKLATKLPAQQKATYLCARAVLYEALGDRQMLEAAEAAFAFSKTSQSAALVAVALHHYGRLKEAISWYKRSATYPHEQGYEVDIGHQGALLFDETPESWLKAWKITLALKKRITYAAHLPTWDGRPCKELQVLSEGGFGDGIQGSRYLKRCTELAEHVTVFLPPFFFEHGYVALAQQQPWFPKIKPLTECKAGVPSAGFFDLPAITQTLPDTVPLPLPWVTERRHSEMSASGDKPRIGFTYGSRAMETPLVQPGTYRTLTEEQAVRIIQQTSDKIEWVNLQHNTPNNLGICAPEIKSWEDTAAIINDLDAVLSVDTAVAHISAAMGKPTHVLLSGAVDWKYGIEGSTCLWYPTMTLWRNNGWGFEDAVTNVIQAINKGELNGGIYYHAMLPDLKCGVLRS